MSTYGPYTPQPAGYSSPPITIVLTVTLLVFFFVGFFTIYFCRCFMENIISSMNNRNSPAGSAIGSSIINQGLDPSLIQAFPTFAYSTVKDFHREKYGLECAICLSEFEDDNVLRLLTVCYHVFHQECIDLWLSSHKTCPVCRRGLDLPQAFEKSPVIVRSNSMNDINGSTASLEDAVSITVKEDEEEAGREERAEEGAPSKSIKQSERNEKLLWQKFWRSHSTGHSMPGSRREEDTWHSLPRSRQEEDRFTLRLPEQVTIKILKGHNWTNSCIPFGDYSRTPTRIHGSGETPGFSSVGEVNRV